MTADERPRSDVLRELGFALAEADAEPPSAGLRDRVISSALGIRPGGGPADPPAPISGIQVFGRAAASLDDLLEDLTPDDWGHPALRDLDVQGLVGHLTGVESMFAEVLLGHPADPDHVGATQPCALAQAGRPGADTHREWWAAVARTLTLVDGRADPEATMTFYGITMPLDRLLIIRAFEMWIHDEDIRRAVDRPLTAPDPSRLARMAELAVALLPFGLASTDRARPDRSVRLVLTGAGGGTWDVGFDGQPVSGRADARVVVDTAAFCRVVGNRVDQSGSDAVVTGDPSVAADVFAGAAALALD